MAGATPRLRSFRLEFGGGSSTGGTWSTDAGRLVMLERNLGRLRSSSSAALCRAPSLPAWRRYTPSVACRVYTGRGGPLASVPWTDHPTARRRGLRRAHRRQLDAAGVARGRPPADPPTVARGADRAGAHTDDAPTRASAHARAPDVGELGRVGRDELRGAWPTSSSWPDSHRPGPATVRIRSLTLLTGLRDAFLRIDPSFAQDQTGLDPTILCVTIFVADGAALPVDRLRASGAA